MKFIHGLLIVIFLSAFISAQGQNIRANRLERHEKRLDRRTEKVDKRNPAGIGRRDEKLERRIKRNVRKQDGVSRRRNVINP
jgi:hypothetical protein